MANYVSSHTGENIDAAVTWVLEDKDTALAGKAEKGDVYTKAQVNAALGAKANTYDVYTRTQVDTMLASKADKYMIVELYSDNTCEVSSRKIAQAVERDGKIVLAHMAYTDTNNYSDYLQLVRLTYMRSDSEPSLLHQRVAEFILVAPITEGSLTVDAMRVVVVRVYQDNTWRVGYQKTLLDATAFAYISEHYAPLINEKVPQSALPESALNVVEGELNNGQFYPWDGDGFSENPVSPMIGKIYVDVTANRMYRYSGGEFIRLQ